MSDVADAESMRRELELLRGVRDASERRLRAMHAVTRVLTEETSIDTALPRILGALGGALGSTLAAYWVPSGGKLSIRATWKAPDAALDWEMASRAHQFGIGEGLPGRMWRDRGLVWLPELDATLWRIAALHEAHVRSGLAFPVIASNELLGVIELFSRDVAGPDDALVEALRTIGAHLGQFVQNARLLGERSQMARASELLSSSLDLDAVVATLANTAVPWLADWCAIHDSNGRSLRESSSRIPIPDHASAIRRVLDTRKSQKLFDREDGSLVIVPLVTRGTAVGTITVTTEHGRRLALHDVHTIEELASRGALAIANAKLYTDATTTSRELELERETLSKLNEIGRRLNEKLDPQTLVQAVIDVATPLTGAQMGAFFYSLVDDRDGIGAYAVAGVARDLFGKLGLPRSTPLLAPTFGGKHPVRLDDISADPRFAKNLPHHGLPEGHPQLRSYLGVPVISRTGNPIGALLFGHADAKVFTDRSQRLAVAFAGHAATAMDNARLFADAQRLIKELEKTNADLDTFAYAASHDLRAPLRGITNLATWIEEDLGTSVPKKVHEHIAMLKGRASRMDRLINGLLELARIGRMRQRPERVDVTELLHETIDLIAPPEASRILIIGAMPTMVAERFALQQVFLNLISNAVQHSQRKDVVVRISAEEHPDEHEFTIADNGVGIAPEHHDRVWQLFQTLQSRDVVETTGIGLALVRKQTEAHGGRAWIEHIPDHQGATFRFTWPKKSR